MLAGCSSSSTLLSPNHRLRSEASAQFQACHIPAMSTQRLDLPRSFSRKDSSSTSRSQPIRPVAIPVEKKPIEKSSGCSLKQNIRLPPVAAETRRVIKDDFWQQCKTSKKRYAGEVEEEEEVEENCNKRVKREKDNNERSDALPENFWFDPGFNVPISVPFVPSSVTCSGEEDNIFVPLPPLSNVPWFDSAATDITEVGDDDKDVEISEEDDSIELITLLAFCVEQISLMNIPGITHCFSRLGELASPRGTVVHRLAAYYTEALVLRVTRQWPLTFQAIPRVEHDLFDDESAAIALRFLNQITPLPKFVHFTANEILLRAFEGKDRVHIIDLDVKQGLQWPSLFQSLATRHGRPPSHVRITGIGESKRELIETGQRLTGFAEALHLPFQFHHVVERLEDIRLWMLHVKENETVAVNCVFQLHKMLHDGGGGALQDFLGLIRSTNAEAVIIAEQEADHNGLGLDARLVGSMKYYAAMFDLIDSTLPLESKGRIEIEEMLGQEIKNIIACEGRDRIERHEDFGKWQQRMEQGGFRCMGIRERELLQGQMILKMYDAAGNHHYSVRRTEKQGHGGAAAALTVNWQDQPLYSVSAWKMPVDDDGGEGSALHIS